MGFFLENKFFKTAKQDNKKKTKNTIET